MSLIRSSSYLLLINLILAQFSYETNGFHIKPTTVTNRVNIANVERSESKLWVQESKDYNDYTDKSPPGSRHLFSPRQARLTLPISTLFTSFAWTGSSRPANAGIGSVVPFEETRKANFKGSITNSVVMLRVKSSLRKRGYFSNKALVATMKSKDDLGFVMSREFGNGKLIDLKDESWENYLKACQNEGKKALLLYGQDVDISPAGDLGQVSGQDLIKTQSFLMEKLASTTLDVTFVGGVVIHRAKTGGKDAGEDCFLPTEITCISKGKVTDIFEEVFGDLPTPRQTVLL